MKIDFSRMVTAEQVQSEEKVKFKNNIASRRYDEETRGIVVNGVAINTERDSQNMINGAVVSCLLNPDYICNWKTPEGFVALDADTIKAVGIAIRTHVQSCFDREAELLVALENGTYTESMLDEGWPDEGVSNNTEN